MLASLTKFIIQSDSVDPDQASCRSRLFWVLSFCCTESLEMHEQMIMRMIVGAISRQSKNIFTTKIDSTVQPV